MFASTSPAVIAGPMVACSLRFSASSALPVRAADPWRLRFSDDGGVGMVSSVRSRRTLSRRGAFTGNRGGTALLRAATFPATVLRTFTVRRGVALRAGFRVARFRTRAAFRLDVRAESERFAPFLRGVLAFIAGRREAREARFALFAMVENPFGNLD